MWNDFLHMISFQLFILLQRHGALARIISLFWRGQCICSEPRSAHSDHFHLDPVDGVSASKPRLSCAVARMGPRAQYNRARIGSTPRKKKPLPGSLDTRFHLRLNPCRAAVDAHIDAVDSTVCP